jgi:hypothetical protein
MTREDAVDKGLEIGEIQGLMATFHSGLAQLVVSVDGKQRFLSADNGALVRALERAFGGVIGEGHKASVEHLIGVPIAYEVTDYGTLAGFSPIDN